MNTTILIALSIVGVLVLFNTAFVVLFFRSRKRDDALRSAQEDGEAGSLSLLQNQLQDVARTLDARMSETTKTVHESVRTQSSESKELIDRIHRSMTEQLMAVRQGMTESTEASKQVFSITEQLQNLERVMTHQKQRGAMGEASLEMILGNILPPGAYKMQHRFDDGETVDAVVMTKDGIIPVDAKFSLDNYNRLVQERDEQTKLELERAFKRDLTRRIDETAKYIKPKQGTLPFAFMFIPAEGIYYDLLVNEIGAVRVNTRSLIDYAYRDKNVIIVSPTTFAAYLQSVLYGFRAFQIEKQAEDIIKNVENLSRHIAAYESFYKKLGVSLTTSVNHYNTANKELKKIDKDVLRITGDSPGVEPLTLEKPETED